MSDHESFMRHWTQAQPIIASYLGAMAKNSHDAEDMLQDVAVILLRKFPEYDPARKFVAWALGIAKMEVLSERRHQVLAAVCRDRLVVERMTDAYVELAPELDVRQDALRLCLESAPDRSRQLLHLRYAESYKPAKIAQTLGMDSGAVRTALSRVRAALQECIERRLAAGQQGMPG